MRGYHALDDSGDPLDGHSHGSHCAGTIGAVGNNGEGVVGVNWDVDPDWIYEQGGLKFALEAQKAGKVRYIGFTGHKDPTYHLKMLAKPYQWAALQMPACSVCL